MTKSSSKNTKKNQPFAKHPDSRSVAPAVIAALLIFNFAYAYGIGIPLAHTIVDAYVESVYALGDMQEQTYAMMGDAVVAGAVALANIPAGFGTGMSNVASVAVAEASPPQHESSPPAPLLVIAPNYIR